MLILNLHIYFFKASLLIKMDISFGSEGGLERARKRRRSNETIMKNGEKEKEINIQVVVRCRYFIVFLFIIVTFYKSRYIIR